jgi:hypothetical protein
MAVMTAVSMVQQKVAMSAADLELMKAEPMACLTGPE